MATGCAELTEETLIFLSSVRRGNRGVALLNFQFSILNFPHLQRSEALPTTHPLRIRSVSTPYPLRIKSVSGRGAYGSITGVVQGGWQEGAKSFFATIADIFGASLF